MLSLTRSNTDNDGLANKAQILQLGEWEGKRERLALSRLKVQTFVNLVQRVRIGRKDMLTQARTGDLQSERKYRTAAMKLTSRPEPISARYMPRILS